MAAKLASLARICGLRGKSRPRPADWPAAKQGRGGGSGYAWPRTCICSSVQQGLPTLAQFAILETDVPEPAAGEVLVEEYYRSVESRQAARLDGQTPLNEAMGGGAIGACSIASCEYQEATSCSRCRD